MSLRPLQKHLSRIYEIDIEHDVDDFLITDPEVAPMAALFHQTLMTSPSARIAGGSDEIMRNIIAERVLGLPADVRVDKDLPWSEIPR